MTSKIRALLWGGFRTLGRASPRNPVTWSLKDHTFHSMPSSNKDSKLSNVQNKSLLHIEIWEKATSRTWRHTRNPSQRARIPHVINTSPLSWPRLICLPRHFDLRTGFWASWAASCEIRPLSLFLPILIRWETACELKSDHVGVALK